MKNGSDVSSTNKLKLDSEKIETPKSKSSIDVQKSGQFNNGLDHTNRFFQNFDGINYSHTKHLMSVIF